MKNLIFKFSLLSAIVMMVFACKKEAPSNSAATLSDNIYDYTIGNAPSFVSERFSLIANDRAHLGRMLFYDKSLSLNGNASCGSCHVQALGFADGKKFSEGFIGAQTPLHSMTLVNIGSNAQFFWDGRATNLEQQVLLPIANHLEMGLDNKELLEAKVAGSSMYAPLFKKAYGSETITSERIGNALASFVASIASFNTKTDRVNNGEDNYTALEQTGKNLFETKYNCTSCHGGSNFNSAWGGSDFANIGLSAEVETVGSNNGRFKVPNLRNVAVTAPYMHDGSLVTLNDVLDHYSHGVKQNSALDWRLPTGGLNISKDEKEAIIAFLNTLTDNVVLTHPKWSNPF